MTTRPPLPPAGWYPDPSDSGQVRWFDGSDWMSHSKPAPQPFSATEGSTADGGLTADSVHVMVFSKPSIGKRGYNEDEVDDFLDRVEQRIRNPRAQGGLTVDDVRNVAFSKPPWGKRGYNEDEVDAFVALVEQQLLQR
jgi:DivIVA domain-containing protein